MLERQPWMTDEMWAEASAWYDSRPPIIQQAMHDYPPWYVFMLNGCLARLERYREPHDGGPVTGHVYVCGPPFNRLVRDVPLTDLTPYGDSDDIVREFEDMWKVWEQIDGHVTAMNNFFERQIESGPSGN